MQIKGLSKPLSYFNRFTELFGLEEILECSPCWFDSWIFTVAEILSHLSQFMTLLPADVVVTATPEGVGTGMKPLQHGNVIELDGGILGSQRQRIV